jgi:hypothetical protein
VPAPEIPRLRNLAMSAALRTALPRGIDPGEIDERLPAARTRRLAFERKLASAEPVNDWRAWVSETLTVEDDWHLGSLGVVDDDFYGRLNTHLTRNQAPQEARHTFEFLYDLASWNLEGAARKAQSLLPLALKGQDWLPPETLLDGAVAACLLTGDVASAHRIFEAIGPHVERDPRDLRMRLARAYLDHLVPSPPKR